MILDAVLDDHVRDIVNRFRNAFELYLSHFYGLKEETVETAFEVLSLCDILRKDQLVHVLLNGVNSL